MVNTKETFDLQSPVFDYEDFLYRIDGDVDLLKEVIVIFLEDTPRLLANLYSGIRSGDKKTVERAVHTLKGATANISAKRLQQLSHHVQLMLKTNDVVHLEPFIEGFEENYEKLDQVLRGYLLE
jgi:HPt (histidine-containing phosphotransfer) domain-containing protein